MNVLSKFVFVIIFFGVLLQHTHAQKTDTTKHSFIAYPIVFYLPETGFGGGFASAFNFHIQKTDSLSPPSQVQLGISYTQKKQVLSFLPFHIYWNQRKNDINGQIEYNHFPYNFYGLSNSRLANKESYTPTSLLFRLNYLRKIHRHIFIGPRLWFRHLQISDVVENGALNTFNYIGGKGGITSGVGGVFLFDKRENVYYPTKGTYFEISTLFNSQVTRSQFNFNRYRFDLRHFISLKKRSVLAIQCFLDLTTENTPFFELPSIGSSSRMRGYLQDTFINRSMILTQIEYRQFFCRRWGYAIFGGVANINDDVSRMIVSDFLVSCGGGIRYQFDTEKRTNIRLDFGLGKNTTGLYLTFGESF